MTPADPTIEIVVCAAVATNVISFACQSFVEPVPGLVNVSIASAADTVTADGLPQLLELPSARDNRYCRPGRVAIVCRTPPNGAPVRHPVRSRKRLPSLASRPQGSPGPIHANDALIASHPVITVAPGSISNAYPLAGAKSPSSKLPFTSRSARAAMQSTMAARPSANTCRVMSHSFGRRPRTGTLPAASAQSVIDYMTISHRTERTIRTSGEGSRGKLVLHPCRAGARTAESSPCLRSAATGRLPARLRPLGLPNRAR